MIASSRAMATACLIGAITLHLGTLVFGLQVDQDTRLEGSAGASVAMLGSAFDDMAAGTLASEPITDVLADAPPETVTMPRPPIETTPRLPADRPVVAAARPAVSERLAPEVSTSDHLIPVGRTPNAAAAARAPTPLPLSPLRSETRAQPVPPDPAPAAAPPTADILTADPQSDTVPATSSRPKQRPKTLQERVARAEPPAQPPTATGNAPKTALRGSATGSQQAAASRQGSPGQSRDSGNAAAANYPGDVMRRLSRVGRPRATSSGTAVVAFSISGNGRLGAVSIAQSSGSQQLDQAALRLVQRASPFPAPPPGAQRSFQVNIKGR